MAQPPKKLKALILDEKNGSGYPAQPDQNGRYDAEGTMRPKAAIGQGAVVFLRRDDGGFDVLCSQRADKMKVHGGRWGIIGGYLEVRDGEGPLEGVWRELREETRGLVDLTGEIPFRVLHPYMDYTDRYNKAAFVVQYMFVIEGKRANKIRAAIQKAVANGDFDSEVRSFDLLPVDGRLEERIAEKGGFGYPQSLRALRMAIHYLPPHKPARPSPRKRAVAPRLAQE